jgi:DNA invertase Pin-like site-specific DNA recombinase
VAAFISYLLVSTHRQGHCGLGIEAQRSAVENYVRSVGGTLLEEYVEVESGGIRDRPVLVQSIARCREKRAVLVIAKLDRLARNVAFISTLMENGVEFIAVDAPYATKFFVHILAAFAEHERAMISERTKAALAAAKGRGVILGSNGSVLAAKHKTAAVAHAAALREPITELIFSGRDTLKQIADGLNEAGYLTREGAQWNPSAVHRVVRRLDLRTPAMATIPQKREQTCSPLPT